MATWVALGALLGPELMLWSGTGQFRSPLSIRRPTCHPPHDRATMIFSLIDGLLSPLSTSLGSVGDITADLRAQLCPCVDPE